MRCNNAQLPVTERIIAADHCGRAVAAPRDIVCDNRLIQRPACDVGVVVEPRTKQRAVPKRWRVNAGGTIVELPTKWADDAAGGNAEKFPLELGVSELPSFFFDLLRRKRTARHVSGYLETDPVGIPVRPG